MKTETDLHLLAVRYLDDAMPAAERDAYVERLRSQEEARHALQDATQHAVTLAEMRMARPARRSAFEKIEKRKPIARRWVRPLALAAATAVLAGMVALLWPQGGVGDKDGLVTVAELVGGVSWRGASGQIRELRARDTGVAAGTFILEDEMAQLEFVFRDGTRVTLRGPAELVVGEDEQKRLHLRSGTLVADVMKQPVGRPMIVRTPTAEGIVLGTRFELFAARESTSLAVNHGLVQLRRLSDNQTVQVPEHRIAEVGRDTSRTLSSAAKPALRRQWRSELSTPPQENWRGDWMEVTGNLPGRMLAVGKMSKHYKAVHFRVVVSALNGVPLVALSPETTIRLRFRLRENVPMELFLNTTTLGGRYAGNFQAYPRLDQARPGKDGWRELTLPFSSFKKIDSPKAARQAEGLCFLYVSTLGKEAGLELAEIEVTPP